MLGDVQTGTRATVPGPVFVPAIDRILPEWTGDLGRLWCTGLSFVSGGTPSQTARLTQIGVNPAGGPVLALAGVPGAIMGFSWYVYDAHYENLDYEVKDEAAYDFRTATGPPELLRYCKRESEDSAEAIGVPGGPYHWVGVAGNPPINEPPAKALATSELRMTFVGWPTSRVPTANIRAIGGKLNASAFDTEASSNLWPFTNHPAGTLLGLGATYRHYKLPYTQRAVTDFTLKFAVRNNGTAADGLTAGWNYFYRHKDGQWREITHNGSASSAGGRTVYQTANYNLAVTPV